MNIARTIFIIVLLSVCNITYSQKRVPRSVWASESELNKNNCIYYKKYSAKKRLSFFPFSKTKSIHIVSYWDTLYADGLKNEDKLNRRIICGDSSFKVPQISEEIILESFQVNLLSDILYNNFYRGKSTVGALPMCHDMSNAILFYDKKDKLIAIIDLGFECHVSNFCSIEPIKTIEMCDQKLERLRIFLKKAGLKKGILEVEHH